MNFIPGFADIWEARAGRAMRLIALAGMAAVASSCAGLGSPSATAAIASPPSNFEPKYFEAQLMLANGDYAAAIETLKPMADDPDCPPEVMDALADAYRAARDVDASLTTLEDLTRRHPTYIPALQDLAETRRRRGETDKAVEAMERAIALEPGNADMLEKAGLWRLQSTKTWDYKGDADSPVGKIISNYKRLCEIRRGTDKVMPLLVLASVYTQVGESEKAIASAKEAVEIKATDIRAEVALAEACEAAGKKGDALAAYRQALLIEPNNQNVRRKIVGLVSSTNAPGGVLGFYEDLAKNFPRIEDIQETYGDELVKAEQWDKAVDHFRRALTVWPDRLKFKTLLVRALFKTGKTSEGEELAKQILADPAVGDAELLQLSDALRSAGKLDMVVELLRRVAASKKDDPRLLLYLANVQIEAKRPADAIKTLEPLTNNLDAILQRKADGFLVVATLGKLYADAGKFDKAHTLYDHAAAKAPKDQAGDLLVMKAQLYRQEKKNAEAIKVVEGMMEGGKAPDAALRLLVDLHDADRSWNDAHASLDRYIEKAAPEGQAQGRRLKAFLYWRAREFHKAAEIMEALHAAAPGDFDMLRFLSEIYIDDNRLDEAMALVDSANGKIDDTLADDVSLIRARIFKAQGKMDGAIGTIEGLIKANPDNDSYLMIAGEYYNEAGRTGDAEKSLRKAIELNPENSEAYNALGYFFADAGIKLDEALTLVNKANELNPGQGHILDSLGWIYYKRGDYAKAVKELESAIGKMAGAPDPVILDHLGDAYLKKGDEAKAKATWAEALKLNPSLAGVKEKLAK